MTGETEAILNLNWKFEMKIEAKEPAGRPSKLRASRRYGMAVAVSTSAGSSSCLIGGRFEKGLA
jgi:hypothetical protein